jgi:hypothetical protein
MSFSCASRTNESILAKGEKTPSRLGFVVTGLLFLALSSAAGAQLPGDDFFPIGVHSQPRSSFDKWKSRGVNTLFQYEAENNSQGVPQVSIQQWSQTAASKGLYYVRLPSANPADDLQEKNLIAWAQKDEPDLSNHSPNPATNIDIYQNWKAIGPKKPVWINFAGPNITVNGADYTQWVKAGDWVASDWYPINWARYNNIGFTGQAVDKLRSDARGVPKKYFAYIECSWQKLSNSERGPTVDELRGTVWHAIMHGANGIIYFPQVVPDKTIGGSFSYDGVPTDVAAEMTRVDAQIQSFGRVLNATRDPSSRRLTTTASGIESTWRVTQEGDYFFVLNQSRNTLTNIALTLSGLPDTVSTLNVLGENRTESLAGTQIVDTFRPFEVHVYSTAGLSGSPVPEPAGLALAGAAACGWAMRRRNRAHIETR